MILKKNKVICTALQVIRMIDPGDFIAVITTCHNKPAAASAAVLLCAHPRPCPRPSCLTPACSPGCFSDAHRKLRRLSDFWTADTPQPGFAHGAGGRRAARRLLRWCPGGRSPRGSPGLGTGHSTGACHEFQPLLLRMLHAFIKACAWLRARSVEVDPILKSDKGAASPAGNVGDVSTELVTDNISEGIWSPPHAQKAQKIKLLIRTRLV